MNSTETITQLFASVLSRWRILWLRLRGVDIRGRVRLGAIDIPRNPGDILLEHGVALDNGVSLIASGTARAGKIRIGARTYVNRNTIFDASHSLEIGEDVMIGPHCYLTDHDHGTATGKRPADLPLVEAPTCIGARVWLGAHVTVLKGVNIGDGAVVGAGSVVTRDIPAGATAVGVPARTRAQADAGRQD